MAYRRYNNDSPEPKPYELIDLATNSKIKRQEPTGHDQFYQDKLTGQLQLQIEALSPVHVASGLMERRRDRNYPLVKTLMRVGNTPVIPGSSVKGSVRSIVEAITASCVRITRTRDLPSSRVLNMKGCNKKEELCLACRMFGAQDFQGLVQFSDLKLIGNANRALRIETVPAFYRPRSREAVYYRQDRGRRVVRGRKFYQHGSEQANGNTPIEVCKVGSEFAGTLNFTNLSRAQLDLLLVALGQSKTYPLYLKLGGAKPACYGSLKIGITQLTIDNPQARYSSWDAPDTEKHDLASYFPVAQGLWLEKQLTQLAHTLRWPNERSCPSGNY